MINLSDMLGKALRRQRTKPRRVTVRDSYDILIGGRVDKLIDNDQIVQEAIRRRSRTTASCSSTRSTRSARAPSASAPM